LSFFDDIGLGDILGAGLNFTLGAPLLAYKGLSSVLGGDSTPALAPLLAPPPVPDATDEEIKQAVLMQRRRLLVGQGIGSTFISGPMGDASGFATSKSTAGGY